MKFHHEGVVCYSLKEDATIYESLGYEHEGETFEDPIQKIRGLFMTLGSHRIELLEPTTSDSPLWPILRRSQKAYHFAYTCKDITKEVGRLTEAGALLVKSPEESVAFGSPITFLLLSNNQLIELIQES